MKFGDFRRNFGQFSRAIRNMDPDKKKKKQSEIGQLWDPDQYAGQRIQEHRPRSAASLHSEAPVDEEREENQVGIQSARGLRNKEGVDLYAVSCHDIAGIWVAFFSRCQRYRCGQAKSNTGEEVGRITMDDSGNFLQDGIPIDFIRILREKIERKRGGTHPKHTRHMPDVSQNSLVDANSTVGCVFVAGVHQLRNLFQSLDKDASGTKF